MWGFGPMGENCAFRSILSGLFGLSMLSLKFAVGSRTAGRVWSADISFGVLWKHWVTV